MDIQLSNQPIESIETEALVVVTFEKDDAPPAFLASLAVSGDLPGKLYESATFHGLAGVKAKRVVAIGGGKRDKFGAYQLRRAAGAAVRLLKPKAFAEIVFVPNVNDVSKWIVSKGEGLEFHAESRAAAGFVPFYQVGARRGYCMYFDLQPA